jgi:hypothetical protein
MQKKGRSRAVHEADQVLFAEPGDQGDQGDQGEGAASSSVLCRTPDVCRLRVSTHNGCVDGIAP